MKRYLTLFLFSAILSALCMAQIEETTQLNFSAEDFTFFQSDRGIDINSQRYKFSYGSDTLAPAIPYIAVNIPLDRDDEFCGYSYTSSSQSLIRENVILNANRPVVPISKPYAQPNQNSLYPDSVYPSENIRQTGSYFLGQQKFICFLVSPFKYDVSSQKLYLLNSIALTIKKKTTQKSYAAKSQSNPTVDYEYVIVTNEELKPAFEKLALWKTIKGVRAKVLTTEQIYQNYTGNYNDTTSQRKIKEALKDYYNGQYHGLQYVLLGGDVEIVPTQRCHVEVDVKNTDGTLIPVYSDHTPSDWYYSCLETMNWDSNHNGEFGEVADNVNLVAELIVSRLPVRTYSEANMMVERIINYERNPLGKQWTKKMLLSGMFLHENKKHELYQDSISDAHFQGEELIQCYISPYWNGQVKRFFDTGTNFAGGANYAFNKAHLQTALSQGYPIVNIDTHGIDTAISMEDSINYTVTEASSLKNTGYSAILTSSCYTNAFDRYEVPEQQSCLSEAFMRNPKGGILAYIGSSRYGFYPHSFYYEDRIFDCFMPGGQYQLARALRDAKNSLFTNCTTYEGAYRWLLLSINMLGDPEMSIFMSRPQKFESLEITNFHDNYIDIYAGRDDEDAMIHVMSKDDMGESFYEHYLGSHVFSEPNDFINERIFCITKPGYIPYVASFGSDTYIQNEDFGHNQTVYSNSTQIGSDVTTAKPQGPVNVKSGKLTINSPEVIIKNNFEVKYGAEFEIDPNN
ncbi:MAG: hypothetical protein IJ197_10825 [Bacteroidaceae bacterium]|nr:hypothetical protein [Bacteroidaceae bacterium]